MNRTTVLRLIALLACLGLLAPTLAVAEANPASEYRISAAQYPEIPRNPDLDIPDDVFKDEALYEEYFSSEEYTNAKAVLYEAERKRWNASIPDREALDSFVQASARAMLSEQDGKNKIYSPVNLWYALFVLSELSGGGCRAQLLDGLGLASQDALLAQAEAMSTTQYWDDGADVCAPGASLWLNRGIQLSPELLGQLARYGCTDVFQGKLGEEGLNDALHAWLNERTNGLLSDAVNGIALQDDMPLAAFTTMYMRAKWDDEFYTDSNSDQVFHTANGDIECPFMYSSENGDIYYGERFTAILRGMRGGERVAFLLPNEGVSPEELLADDDIYDLLKDTEGWKNLKFCMINISVPKLDCNCDMSFVAGLERMGITDVFHADSFVLSEEVQSDTPIYVSCMDQSSRLIMDEKGIEAVSMIKMLMLGALPPQEEFDFTLDRPFLMAIIGLDNMPVFIGVINSPVE